MTIEEFSGFCSVCDLNVTFSADGTWYRSTLQCPACKSVVRERAVALRVKQLLPNWREAAIHEVAPVSRGFTLRLRTECPAYIGTHWFPGEDAGSMVRGYRNENVEAQTFGDGVFDCVISLDVMEHLFDPAAAYREIFRTLKPGGAYIHTFPITKSQVPAVIDRAQRDPDGTVRHLVEKPEYHGNPIDTSGSLVTKSYGYDIGKQIADWVPFDVDISRFWHRGLGIMGEYTEVVVCQRPN